MRRDSSGQGEAWKAVQSCRALGSQSCRSPAAQPHACGGGLRGSHILYLGTCQKWAVHVCYGIISSTTGTQALLC